VEFSGWYKAALGLLGGTVTAAGRLHGGAGTNQKEEHH
jgi:hypothetical protein